MKIPSNHPGQWAVAAAIFAAAFAGAAYGDGGDRAQAETATRASCAGKFRHETYYAGPRFEGLAVTNAERFCERLDPVDGTESFVSYRYGDCDPPPEEGGCTAPLEIQSAPLCAPSSAL